MAKKKSLVVHTWFGGGSWVIEYDPEEIELLSKTKGLTQLDLKVSSLPNDRVYLEEFFQEHVEKEEWPRASAALAGIKGCCMCNQGASICADLLNGKKPWDGSTPYDND
jgi:hypothetical protein